MAMIISIHSAARAETRIMEDVVRRIKISIHSAARAETCTYMGWKHSIGNFNPLRREGGDSAIQHFTLSITISIHSAARAETGQNRRFPVASFRFQSTPPRGRRL